MASNIIVTVTIFKTPNALSISNKTIPSPITAEGKSDFIIRLSDKTIAKKSGTKNVRSLVKVAWAIEAG